MLMDDTLCSINPLKQIGKHHSLRKAQFGVLTIVPSLPSLPTNGVMQNEIYPVQQLAMSFH